MKAYTKEELEEGIRALSSLLMKCEKVEPKLKEGGSQRTLIRRRMEALRLAVELMGREKGKIK